MQSYMDQFYSLGGRTIGEHQRNFRNYKTVIAGLHEAEVSALLNAVNPRNHQEEIFYTKLLLFFEHHEKLLQIFVSCNKVLNRIIVKDRKFIGFVVSHFGASGFAERLCPKLSYVARCLLVNKLGLFLKRGDDFFKAVTEKYGLRAALKLLPTCSETLIKVMISDYNVDFNSRELIRMYKKYPGLLKFYFESTKNSYVPRKMLLRYLIKNDMPGLISLCSNYSHRMFGRKGFLKFLRINKEYVIDNPAAFQAHIKSIYRHLSVSDYKRYLRNLFPKNIDELFRLGTILDNFKLLPIDERWRLFCDIYKDLYSIEYTETDETFLEIISAEDRLRFDLKDFWHFYPLKEAIEKIKIKINLTQEISLRADLLNKLIETCKINDDKNALLEVLQYFILRHKNETVEVRKHFICSLIDNFNLITLSDEHWKYINEILLIFEVKGDSYYNKSHILKMVIYRKMRKGEKCDEELVKFLKETGLYGCWRLLKNHPVQERECLLRLPQLWAKIKHFSENAASVTFLQTIHAFNKNYPNYRISYYKFPVILRSLMDKIAKSEDTKVYTVLVNSILRFIPVEESEKELREQVLEFFVEDSYFIQEALYLWILKYRPQAMFNDVERILIKLRKFSVFNYEVSKMHYNGISEAFSDAATRILRDNERIHLVPKILWCLSYNPEYLQLIGLFAPSADCKINLHSKEMKARLNVQRIVLKTLKNTFKQSDNIPTILHHSNGDYLQYCLEPMYRTLYHTPQNLLEAPLTILASRSVSVRKHSIYLSTALLPMKRIVEILKELGLKENNASIKKSIFKCNYTCLMSNPALEIFELFKSNLPLLDENDSESLDMIFQFHKIPTKIFVDYISLIWDFADSTMEGEKYAIIGHLNKDIIDKIPEECCLKILEDSLFNPMNRYKSDTNKFVYNYITSSKSNAVKYLINKISKTHLESLKFAREIFSCFEEICKLLLKDIDKPKALDVSLQLLCEVEAKSAFHNFKINVLLKFVVQYLGKGYESLPNFIVDEQKALIEAYGAEIFVHYTKIVDRSLHIIHTSMEANLSETIYALIQRLLQISSSIHIKLLAIQLLPLAPSRNVQHKKYHAAIKEELKKDPNPLIEIFFEFNNQ